MAARKGRYLPVEPFAQFLQQHLRDHYQNVNQMALKAGVGSSRMNEYLNCQTRDKRNNNALKKRERVEMETVDKVATRLGVHITAIYDDYLDWPDLDE